MQKSFFKSINLNYLSIFVLTIFLYIGFDRILSALGSNIATEAVSAAISVIFVVITTMFMLKKQSDIDSNRDLNNEIFKKKINMYTDAFSLWLGIAQNKKSIEFEEVSQCLQIQLQLVMTAPNDVVAEAIEITKLIAQASSHTNERQELEEDPLFTHIAEFAKLARKDLNLPETDAELDENMLTIFSNVFVNAAKENSRNYDKFEFKGQTYPKNRLVLALVKEICARKNISNFEDLVKALPDQWHSQGKASKSEIARVVMRLDDVVTKADLNKRFFTKPDERLTLKDGEIAVVSNQWGDNIDYFIDMVKKTYSIDIKRIKQT